MSFHTLPYIFYSCIALTVVAITCLFLAGSPYDSSDMAPRGVADFTASVSRPDPERGAELWNRYVCCSCQEVAEIPEGGTPPVAEVRANWSDYDREELLAILIDSSEQVRQGKPEGTQLWEAVTPAILTKFKDLSYRDLQDMLAYVSTTG